MVFQSGQLWGIGINVGGFVYTEIQHHVFIDDYGMLNDYQIAMFNGYYRAYQKDGIGKWTPDIVTKIGKI